MRKQEKVWNVTLGDNWVQVSVIARNYIEAARKALRIDKPPKHQRFVKSIELSKYIYR